MPPNTGTTGQTPNTDLVQQLRKAINDQARARTLARGLVTGAQTAAKSGAGPFTDWCAAQRTMTNQYAATFGEGDVHDQPAVKAGKTLTILQRLETAPNNPTRAYWLAGLLISGAQAAANKGEPARFTEWCNQELGMLDQYAETFNQEAAEQTRTAGGR